MPLVPHPTSLQNPLVEVRHSAVHGYGVFAKQKMPRGTFIAFYEGRRYTQAQIARMKWNDRLTYLFGLSDGTTIDGGRGGNVTRHLNHACKPNCEAQEVEGPDGLLTLRIETIRVVPAGAELFIDYALTIDATADPLDYPCHCASTACRGVMVGVV